MASSLAESPHATYGQLHVIWLFGLETCSRQKQQFVLGTGILAELRFAKDVLLGTVLRLGKLVEHMFVPTLRLGGSSLVLS